MKTVLLIISVFLSFSVLAQSAKKHSPTLPTVFRGIASYYHSKFEGRRMANGEKFSQAKYTAACNILPLNKWVRVTNISNGRSVIVKITDRMAKSNKRLVDLSYTSAKDLRMTGHGLVKVKMELLEGYKPPQKAIAQE